MEWKPVLGFEGIYEVSDQGDVRRSLASQGTRAGFVLKPRVDRKGYVYYGLRNGAGVHRKKAHRLVLEAFVGSAPEDKPFGLHADANPANNHLSNLRWGSPSENMADRKRNRGWDLGQNHNGAKQVCPSGHLYSEANTYLYLDRRSGYVKRKCRTCRREAARARYRSAESRRVQAGQAV